MFYSDYQMLKHFRITNKATKEIIADFHLYLGKEATFQEYLDKAWNEAVVKEYVLESEKNNYLIDFVDADVSNS